jgi:hypothetical protein
MKCIAISYAGSWSVALAMLGLTACATQQGPRPVASYYEATRDSQIEASGPVAADDASIRVKSSSRQVSSTSSRVMPDGETSREKSKEIVGTDVPVASQPPVAPQPPSINGSNPPDSGSPQSVATDAQGVAAPHGQGPSIDTKARETVKETTETTTVVGSIPVAAPDSEVKFTNQ